MYYWWKEWDIYAFLVNFEVFFSVRILKKNGGRGKFNGRKIQQRNIRELNLEMKLNKET